jgi:hypothetical protein
MRLLRTLRAAAFALAALALPLEAAAQRITVPTSTAAASSGPPNITYELEGYASDGSTTQFSSGATNAYSSFTSIGSAVAANWCAFTLDFGKMGNSSSRFLVQVSADGGTTKLVDGLYVQAATTSHGSKVRIPLGVTAGQTVSIALRAATSGATLTIGVIGEQCQAGETAPYTSMVSLTTVSSDTKATSTDVATNGAASWTQVSASTADTYKAFMVVASENGTAPVAEPKSIGLGVGAAGSETEIYRYRVLSNASSPNLPRADSGLIQHQVAAGNRIAVKAYGATTADNVRIQVFGFK